MNINSSRNVITGSMAQIYYRAILAYIFVNSVKNCFCPKWRSNAQNLQKPSRSSSLSTLVRLLGHLHTRTGFTRWYTVFDDNQIIIMKMEDFPAARTQKV